LKRRTARRDFLAELRLFNRGDGAAHVLAAATSADADGTWTPYVGFEVDGSVIQLAMLEGSTIVCTLIEPR
jgi:hypothetical protein